MSNPESMVLRGEQRIAKAHSISVPNAREVQAHKAFETVFNQPRGARALPLIADSQTGKSTIIKNYISSKYSKVQDDGEVPVIWATLSANLTRKQMVQGFLQAYEPLGIETGWRRGSEVDLLDRFIATAKHRKTRLIFADEFHHSIHSDRHEPVKSVCETVKTILISDVCSIVLCGIDTVRIAINASEQLKQRCHKPFLVFNRLDPQNENDMTLYTGFVIDLLDEWENHQIILSGEALKEEPALQAILEATDGVLGRSANLLKDALELADEADEDNISLHHLKLAVDHLHLLTDTHNKPKNPFDALLRRRS